MIYNESKFNSEWDTLPLSKLGEFNRGKSKHRPRNDSKLFVGGKYPLIQTGEIKAANLYIDSHKAAYNEFGLKQSKLWDAGTLAITIAANIAETGILAYPMCFPDSCVGFVADKKKTSELFMHYVFTYIRKSIQTSSLGSIQDNINIELLTALNFKIPAKKNQESIVELLVTIDKKIELNNSINAELEAIAQTIYSYWFVQFDFPNDDGKQYKTSGGKMEWNQDLKREIPIEWKVEKIENCCDVIDCLHAKKPDLNFETEDSFLLQLENLRDDGLLDLSNKYYVSKKDYNLWISRIEVTEHDILITNAGRVAATVQVNKGVKAGIGRNITAIRPNKISPTYFYHALTGVDMHRQIQKNSDLGSFFSSLNVWGIKELFILRPNNNIEETFEETVYKYRRMREKNFLQNQELIRLRDFLIPLLMNGQVKVH